MIVDTDLYLRLVVRATVDDSFIFNGSRVCIYCNHKNGSHSDDCLHLKAKKAHNEINNSAEKLEETLDYER